MSCWALAAGVFAWALSLSLAAARNPNSGDLRYSWVVCIDAVIATGIALGYSLLCGVYHRQTAWWCIGYGLMAAGAFRILPPVLNESCLYFSHIVTPDVPYVILGAIVHGAAAILLSYYYLQRAAKARPVILDVDPDLYRMNAATMFVFVAVAAAIRLDGAFHA